MHRRHPPPPPPPIAIPVPGPWTPAAAATAAASVFSHLVYARSQAPAPLEALPPSVAAAAAAAPPSRPTPASRRAAAVHRLAAAARATLATFTPSLFTSSWPRHLLIGVGAAAARPVEAYDVVVAPAEAGRGGAEVDANAVRHAVARALLVAPLPTADVRPTKVHVHMVVEAASEAARGAGLAPARALAPSLTRARRVAVVVGPAAWVTAAQGSGEAAAAALPRPSADVMWWGVRQPLAGVPPCGGEMGGSAGWGA